MSPKTISVILCLLFSTLLLGCSGAANQAATETEASNQTQAAINFSQTQEVRDLEKVQEAVLQTQAADDDSTATARALKTVAAQASKTAGAEAVKAAKTKQAEAVLSSIDDVLQTVGHSTATGKLSWMQSGSESITISSGNWRKWLPLDGKDVYSDFVIHFNTTWDTSGLAGCGLIFRAEKDLLNGQQYIIDTIRFSGFPGWRVRLYDYSDVQSYITGSVKFTNKLDLDNKAVNNYVFVAEGSTLTVYINGSRISGVTLATRSEGIFAWYAWQTDGKTKCTFEDGWIWELP